MDFYDEALKWRELAKEMHKVLGNIECTCVESQEYSEYRTYLASLPTKEERMLYAILEPFEGDEVSDECRRCEAMLCYEEAVGWDTLAIEHKERTQ